MSVLILKKNIWVKLINNSTENIRKLLHFLQATATGVLMVFHKKTKHNIDHVVAVRLNGSMTFPLQRSGQQCGVLFRER